MFFDVDTAGNVKGDLYIFETKGLDAGDYGSEFERFIRQGRFKEDEGDAYREANYICIKNNNTMASYNIENIISGTKGIYVNNYISDIKASVASWLNNYNTNNGTDYSTVMEAIEDGVEDKENGMIGIFYDFIYTFVYTHYARIREERKNVDKKILVVLE